MKRFTPELLFKFGSEDDQVANSASAEWDKTHQAYVEHLDSIQQKLPKSVQMLLNDYCLHDAKVVSMGRDERLFSILLQLAEPGDKGVLGILLTYKLVSQPRFKRHASLADEGVPLEWLYDELDLLDDGDDPWKEETFQIFTHSILFTAGRELQLDFYELELQEYQKLFSSGKKSQESEEAEFESLVS
ncbi:MAG TPA: DUF4085 family protein [Gemmataceae bacterium]|jgi:hypothetical protein|nr:DUF4085 family protein [Gemmataceae bacterium]